MKANILQILVDKNYFSFLIIFDCLCYYWKCSQTSPLCPSLPNPPPPLRPSPHCPFPAKLTWAEVPSVHGPVFVLLSIPLVTFWFLSIPHFLDSLANLNFWKGKYTLLFFFFRREILDLFVFQIHLRVSYSDTCLHLHWVHESIRGELTFLWYAVFISMNIAYLCICISLKSSSISLNKVL